MPVSTKWINLTKICNLHIFAGQKLDANQYLRHKKVEQLLADVHDSSDIGEAIDIDTAVLKTAVNLMSNTVFSIDLADSSDTALVFGKIIQGIKEELGKPNFADYFPTLLGNLDLQGIRRRMAIHFQKLMNLFDKLIDMWLELRKMNDYISSNDLLDTLLRISQDDNQELDRKHIKHFIFDLFTAGTETTTSTSEWAMAELLRNRKTLLEARRELQQTIGQKKMVDESNITCLPYLQAIVKETLRLHPPVPLLVP
ncbi:phosphate translocator-related family protein [Hibiscus syriacus]|uniref:Phosphate translocator-related family protein n=2 Tax=Hibiscus syriacus TaxID=106335 RepID=A0A6A2XWJ7_HIBSY|nr:phosphate translocator-related family protein [Hibiscus syriacus]